MDADLSQVSLTVFFGETVKRLLTVCPWLCRCCRPLPTVHIEATFAGNGEKASFYLNVQPSDTLDRVRLEARRYFLWTRPSLTDRPGLTGSALALKSSGETLSRNIARNAGCPDPQYPRGSKSLEELKLIGAEFSLLVGLVMSGMDVACEIKPPDRDALVWIGHVLQAIDEGKARSCDEVAEFVSGVHIYPPIPRDDQITCLEHLQMHGFLDSVPPQPIVPSNFFYQQMKQRAEEKAAEDVKQAARKNKKAAKFAE